MSDLFAPSYNDHNGVNATKSPFKRPVVGDDPLLWYIDKSPNAHAPFMGRVLASEAGKLRFVLLDRETGTDLHGEADAIEVDRSDLASLYCAMPASLHLATPGDTSKECGFLMLTVEFITKLKERFGEALVVKAQGSGKWPRGVADKNPLKTGLAKLFGASRGALSNSEAAAVERLLAVLD
jgi:hypothetical protein